MTKLPSITAALALALLLAGCERTETIPAPPATRPATQPAATPATKPTTRPEVSTMSLSPGGAMQFPAPRLRLDRRDGVLFARLHSEDARTVPPEAAGNSYYFDMQLDTQDEAELRYAVWAYKSPSGERADSPNGIFLQNMKFQLQPDDVRIELTAEPDQTAIHITGRFLMFTQSAILPEPVLVDGRFAVPTERK